MYFIGVEFGVNERQIGAAPPQIKAYYGVSMVKMHVGSAHAISYCLSLLLNLKRTRNYNKYIWNRVQSCLFSDLMRDMITSDMHVFIDIFIHVPVVT